MALDHSPESDDEDDVNLSKLFKKEAKQVSDNNDNDDGRESTVKKPVKGKSPRKNDKSKRTPERKSKNVDDSEREGSFLYFTNISVIMLYPSKYKITEHSV